MDICQNYIDAIHEITIEILNRTNLAELLIDIVTHASALVMNANLKVSQ